MTRRGITSGRVAWARRWLRAGTASAALLVLFASGCTRAFWRENADASAYRILEEKTYDLPAVVSRLDVTPDPRSRFFDPYDPDREPLPPDDPAAHEYMHWVRGFHGYRSWHKYGDLISVENPQWLDNFGLTADPQGFGNEPAGYRPGIEGMTLAEAIELALIHSRDYQLELETLYQSALALSFERFRFNVRYLGAAGGEPRTALNYTGQPSGPDQLGLSSTFGVSQLLPTGGQWAAEIANNTLWLFSGDNRTTTASVLSFSLVQPLLLGAGRKVSLESLTLAERNVLYAARDFAKFRQDFFVNTVSGGGASAGGYLGLLRQRQVILNQRQNIEALEVQVERLRALGAEKPRSTAALEQLPVAIPAELANALLYDADRKLLVWRGEMTAEQFAALVALSADPAWRAAVQSLFEQASIEIETLEVTQLASQVASQRNSLLQAERNFQDALDRYKIQLGLPPDMAVSLDLQLLRPFQLIDPTLYELQNLVIGFVSEWAALEMDATPAQIRGVVEKLDAIRQEVELRGVKLVERDFERMESLKEQRLSELRSAEDRDRLIHDLAADRRQFETVKKELAVSAQVIKELLRELATDDVPVSARIDAINAIADLREDLERAAKNLAFIQIGERVEMIMLTRFEMGLEQVTTTALENRLDLMNERGVVMDARRQQEIAANQLLSVLNLNVEADVATRPLFGNDNPLKFQGDETTFRAGVSFTAPLDQVRERNIYRNSLIAYQQARRRYMAAEDQVKLQVRQDWRQLQVFRENFEIARLSVRLAAKQYDQAVERSFAPVAGGGAGGGTRGANSGLNLLQALNTVLQAQNQLVQIWADYEANRLNIHRDMGIMQIDETGVWIDGFYQTLEELQPREMPRADDEETMPSESP